MCSFCSARCRCAASSTCASATGLAISGHTAAIRLMAECTSLNLDSYDRPTASMLDNFVRVYCCLHLHLLLQDMRQQNSIDVGDILIRHKVPNTR